MNGDDFLKQKEKEHEELQFSSFSNDRALEIGLRIVEIAKEKNYPITVDIRRNSQQLFHCACPGTGVDNDHWVERKSNVAEYFGKSSFYIKTLLETKRLSLREMSFLDETEYSAFGGAFPIFIRDTGSVGTVTVSGLPDEEDHNLVVSVLREFL